MPIPANANVVRLIGKWYDGSTTADSTVDDSVPALMFDAPKIADSSRLSARNQPIDGETLTLRKSGASIRPAEPPSSSTPGRPYATGPPTPACSTTPPGGSVTDGDATGGWVSWLDSTGGSWLSGVGGAVLPVSGLGSSGV